MNENRPSPEPDCEIFLDRGPDTDCEILPDRGPDTYCEIFPDRDPETVERETVFYTNANGHLSGRLLRRSDGALTLMKGTHLCPPARIDPEAPRGLIDTRRRWLCCGLSRWSERRVRRRRTWSARSRYILTNDVKVASSEEAMALMTGTERLPPDDRYRWHEMPDDVWNGDLTDGWIVRRVKVRSRMTRKEFRRLLQREFQTVCWPIDICHEEDDGHIWLSCGMCPHCTVTMLKRLDDQKASTPYMVEFAEARTWSEWFEDAWMTIRKTLWST